MVRTADGTGIEKSNFSTGKGKEQTATEKGDKNRYKKCEVSTKIF